MSGLNADIAAIKRSQDELKSSQQEIRRMLKDLSMGLPPAGAPPSQQGAGKPEGVIGNLRDEIIESQKARMDLVKWKVILIAAIGGSALGLGESANEAGTQGAPLLFALLPLACIYVDIVCIHNDIRMMLIGCFLREAPEGAPRRYVQGVYDVNNYEKFCEKFRSVFALENLALTGTTISISAFVAAIGLTWEPIKETRTLLVVLSSAVFAASWILALWKTIRLRDMARNRPSRRWGRFYLTGLVVAGLGTAGIIASRAVAGVLHISPELAIPGIAIGAAVLILFSSTLGMLQEKPSNVDEE